MSAIYCTYIGDRKIEVFARAQSPAAIFDAAKHMRALGLSVDLFATGTWDAKRKGERWTKSDLLFLSSDKERAEHISATTFRIYHRSGDVYVCRPPRWESASDSEPHPAKVIVRGTEGKAPDLTAR